MSSGTLYGVSTGPGDPELMTLKAIRIIEQCSVIAAPINFKVTELSPSREKARFCTDNARNMSGDAPLTHETNSAALSIAEQVCDLSGKTVIKLRFTMSRDKEILSQSHLDIAAEISKYLDDGKDAAFITIGDISIYSTFWYIARILRERGYEIEVCAGVPSFCAAAAAVKEPLVLGNEPLAVVPAGCRELEKLCSVDGTKVIMKSGRSVDKIREKLSGKAVYAVENCGYENQKIFNPLDDTDDSGYFTTIIVKEE